MGDEDSELAVEVKILQIPTRRTLAELTQRLRAKLLDLDADGVGP